MYVYVVLVCILEVYTPLDVLHLHINFHKNESVNLWPYADGVIYVKVTFHISLLMNKCNDQQAKKAHRRLRKLLRKVLCECASDPYEWRCFYVKSLICNVIF